MWLVKIKINVKNVELKKKYYQIKTFTSLTLLVNTKFCTLHLGNCTGNIDNVCKVNLSLIRVGKFCLYEKVLFKMDLLTSIFQLHLTQ